MIDLHTHILPGVDDGSESVEGSLRLAEALWVMGFERIFLTPHWPTLRPYREGPEPVARDLEDRAADLARRAAPSLPRVRFHPGAEYPLDEELPRWCSYRPGGGRFVLVDACFQELPHDPGRLIRPLREAGLRVLLVHPERSHALRGGSAALASFLAEGAALVGNLGSLSGLYRRAARDAARDLLDRGLYWAFASDLHNPSQVPFIEKGLEELSRRVTPAAMAALVDHNPRRVAEEMETRP